MAAPKKIDYERIEPEWRAGIKSPAQLAAEYTEATGVSVSHAAIIKHFRKLGIPRDLTEKVHAKADAMVMQAMVTGKVTTETLVKESEIIAKGAMDVANVRLDHRSDIRRARSLGMQLLGELEGQSNNAELLDELGDLLRSEDEKGVDRLNDIYRKVISLPQRIDSMKKLADTLKTLVELERKAYGLDADDKGKGSNPIDKMSADDVDARIAELERKLGRV